MGDLRRILIDLSGLADDSYSEMSIKINQMLEERGKVSDAFDTVLRAMFRINGGVGSLGEAADNVDSRRTKTDAASEAAMEAAHRFVATFVKHTKERDRMVAKRSLASETREANAYARDRVENGSLLERVMAANMLGGSRASDTTGLRAVEAGDFTARNPKEGLMQIGLVAGSGLLILFGGEFLMAGGATVLRVAAMNFGSKLLTSSLKLGSRFLASTSKYSLLTYFRAMAVKVGIQNLLREAATSALAWGMRVSASNTMRLIMSAYKGGVALGAISGTVNLLSGLCSGESWEQIARRTSDGASAGFLSGFSWGGAAAAQSAILAIVGKLITSLGSDIAVNLNRGGDFDTDFWVQSGGKAVVTAALDGVLLGVGKWVAPKLSEGIVIQRATVQKMPSLFYYPARFNYLGSTRESLKVTGFGTFHTAKSTSFAQVDKWIMKTTYSKTRYTFNIAENMTWYSWYNAMMSNPEKPIGILAPSLGDVVGRGIFDDSLWGIATDQVSLQQSFVSGRKTVE